MSNEKRPSRDLAAAATAPVRPREVAPPVLHEVQRVLEQHLADDRFTVEDLARGLRVSRATLYRRLAGVVRHSPMQLIWHHRLDRAAVSLRETDATVAAIARGVGFRSVPHFCSRFRSRFGLSPSAFRRGAAPPA